MKFILGKKIEMSQMFDEKGNLIPVTLIEAGPCTVLQVKNKEKDKYEAIQIGYEEVKKVKKSNAKKPYKHLKEFSAQGEMKYDVGDKIDASIFNEKDIVMVSGMSKGKGFQGVIKRHKFSSKRATHGVKHEERAMGSAGPTYPQRVTLGRKMPGHMGFEKTAVRNLEIIKIDKDNNLIVIKGAVPGRRGTLLEIKSAS